MINSRYAPIVGYNYGCNNLSRVKETLKLTITFTILSTIVGMLVIQIFPYQIIGMFNRDTCLLSQGILTLRIIIIMTPFIGYK
jgi:Na+-driven multidrug efflux pump